jgi:carbonic anhydrase
MKILNNLLSNNKKWAKDIETAQPGFFQKLSKQQNPEYLWIGCSDSRVPANEIVGMLPGELFVHRNVANVVAHSDLNCLSVVQYAVEALKVKHIIVCGHYGCGGIAAALTNEKHGFIDNWLSNIKDVYIRHEKKFMDLKSEEEKVSLLCELNVIEQVNNVAHTTIVQDAWDRGSELTVHGWIYGIHDGLLKDLEVSISDKSSLHSIYRIEN